MARSSLELLCMLVRRARHGDKGAMASAAAEFVESGCGLHKSHELKSITGYYSPVGRLRALGQVGRFARGFVAAAQGVAEVRIDNSRGASASGSDTDRPVEGGHELKCTTNSTESGDKSRVVGKVLTAEGGAYSRVIPAVELTKGKPVDGEAKREQKSVDKPQPSGVDNLRDSESVFKELYENAAPALAGKNREMILPVLRRFATRG